MGRRRGAMSAPPTPSPSNLLKGVKEGPVFTAQFTGVFGHVKGEGSQLFVCPPRPSYTKRKEPRLFGKSLVCDGKVGSREDDVKLI